MHIWWKSVVFRKHHVRLKRFSPGHRRAWREHKLVHDLLTRHAQTETWGVYSQVHVMSSDNTSTPWKLCSFSIFPILILRKICSHFAEYFFCPIGSSTVTNKNSKFKTEGRSTGQSIVLPGHFLFHIFFQWTFRKICNLFFECPTTISTFMNERNRKHFCTVHFLFLFCSIYS